MNGQRSGRDVLFRALTALVAVLLAVSLAACAQVASPKGWAGPVAVPGGVLAADQDELLLVDLESGNVSRLFPPEDGDNDEKIDPTALYGTPSVEGGRVYVPAYDGTLYAVEIESQTVVWRFETDGPLIGGVTLADGTLYVGSADGKLYAVNVEDGEQQWALPFTTGDEIWSAPAVAGGVVYVTSMDGRVYALDAATGRELWSFETGAGIASPPVVAGDRLFVGSLDSRMYALDAASGKEMWSFKAGNWFLTRPLVSEGMVYAGSLDHKVYALDAASGELRWSQELEAPVRSSPVLAGGVLVIVDREGNIYGLAPAEGATLYGPIWLQSDVLADPLLLGDEVLLSTTDGKLLRVDPETGRRLETLNLRGAE